MKARDMNRNPRGRASAIPLRKNIASGGGDHNEATFGCLPLDYCEIPARDIPNVDHVTNSDKNRAIPAHEAGSGQNTVNPGRRYR